MDSGALSTLAGAVAETGSPTEDPPKRPVRPRQGSRANQAEAENRSSKTPRRAGQSAPGGPLVGRDGRAENASIKDERP